MAITFDQVYLDTLHIVGDIQDNVNNNDDRGQFVQDLLNAASTQSGNRYNVMIFNQNEPYVANLQGQVFAATTTNDVPYGVWIFESGDFTNNSDGGWINWGFSGSFERHAGYVVFHQFAAASTAQVVDQPKEEQLKV